MTVLYATLSKIIAAMAWSVKNQPRVWSTPSAIEIGRIYTSAIEQFFVLERVVYLGIRHRTGDRQPNIDQVAFAFHGVSRFRYEYDVMERMAGASLFFHSFLVYILRERILFLCKDWFDMNPAAIDFSISW